MVMQSLIVMVSVMVMRWKTVQVNAMVMQKPQNVWFYIMLCLIKQENPI